MLQCVGALVRWRAAVLSAMLIESAGVSRSPNPDCVKLFTDSNQTKNEKNEAGWRWSGLLQTSCITNIYNQEKFIEEEKTKRKCAEDRYQRKALKINPVPAGDTWDLSLCRPLQQLRG